jgi:hypothetical protein
MTPQTETQSDRGNGGGGAGVAVGQDFPDDIREIGDRLMALDAAQARALQTYLAINMKVIPPQRGIVVSE